MSSSSTKEEHKLKEELKGVLHIYTIQTVLAVLLTVASVGVLYGGYYLCDCIPYPKSDTLQDKLVYFIRCCVLPCVAVLCWAIVSVAMKRTSSRALNPLSGYEEFVQPQKNILNNTVEQLLVFLMTCLVLTTYLDNTELCILPLYSLLWVTGRLTFAIGYSIHPMYRTFQGLQVYAFLHINMRKLTKSVKNAKFSGKNFQRFYHAMCRM